MGARILIVDDEEIVIKSCLRILGGGDYYVEVAHDGREALRKIEENPYDVMILDVVMPNIDGLEVLRRVKETHPDMDVIMVTACRRSTLWCRRGSSVPAILSPSHSSRTN